MKGLIISLTAILPIFLLLSSCQKNIDASSGTIKITFRNTVNGSPLALNSQIYCNPFKKLATVKKGRTSEIIIEADLNTCCQNPNDIKIAVNPVITTPGVLAKKVADNYSKMFTIKDVTNF